MVSASQTIQHGKWLEEANHLPWRAKVPSLNILLTSTTWRNDHNGFSHQGPGLIQNVITQRGDVSRVYLPPDANTLLSVADHCLRSRSYINLIVIDKQPQQQWLTIDEAVAHCASGAGIWTWAGNDDGSRDPDIVLACAGDVVTMETVAAAQLLQEMLPDLIVRVVNVVDLMTLPRPQDHPHGIDNTFFTRAVHRSRRRGLLVPRVPRCHPPAGARAARRRPVPRPRLHRAGHHDHAVRHGGPEPGVALPPGDGRDQQRQADPTGASAVKAWASRSWTATQAYIVEHLEDMPEVRDWTWQRPGTTQDQESADA